MKNQVYSINLTTDTFHKSIFECNFNSAKACKNNQNAIENISWRKFLSIEEWRYRLPDCNIYKEGKRYKNCIHVWNAIKTISWRDEIKVVFCLLLVFLVCILIWWYEEWIIKCIYIYIHTYYIIYTLQISGSRHITRNLREQLILRKLRWAESLKYFLFPDNQIYLNKYLRGCDASGPHGLHLSSKQCQNCWVSCWFCLTFFGTKMRSPFKAVYQIIWSAVSKGMINSLNLQLLKMKVLHFFCSRLYLPICWAKLWHWKCFALFW